MYIVFKRDLICSVLSGVSLSIIKNLYSVVYKTNALNIIATFVIVMIAFEVS